MFEVCLFEVPNTVLNALLKKIVDEINIGIWWYIYRKNSLRVLIAFI